MEIKIDITENKAIQIPDDSDLGKLMSVFTKNEYFTIDLSKNVEGFEMIIRYHAEKMSLGYSIVHKFDNQYKLIF